MRFLPRLLPLPLLAACSLIDAATQEKPSSRQTAAMGNIFQQIGTAAAVIDEPGTASDQDLAELVQFRHYARLVDPSVSGKPGAAGKPDGAPGCIDVLENGERQVDCDVTVSGGRRCKVTGSMTRSPGEGGARYAGRLVLGPAPVCPDGSLDFDVYLEGPTGAPLVADGHLSFSYEDPDGNGDIFSGSGAINRIATGACEVPSQGTLEVAVQGVVDGKNLDSRITLGFHHEPACGVTLIE